MVRVPVPDGISAGVLDLRHYGEGMAEVAETDGGTRYIDIDGSSANRIRRDWDNAGYTFDTRTLAEVDEQPEEETEDEAEPADDLDAEVYCTTVKSDGEICGRELPCQYHTEE